MADQKRCSSTNDQTVDERRNHEVDNQNGHLAHDTSRLTSERNTGDDQALQPQIPMDVELTDRSQTVQPQEESPCIPHTQIVTGTTMNTFGNTGPVQIGTGNTNTVIKNPVYKNCNVQHHHHHHHHHHPDNYRNFLRMSEQAASSLESGPTFPGQPACPAPPSSVGNPLHDHGNRDTSGQSQTDRRTLHPSHHNASRDNTSNHVPCHCQDCLLYHHNDHRPLDEHHRSPRQDSKHRHQRLPHPPVPQLPIPRQTENEECTKEREKVKDGVRRGNPTSDTKPHTANKNQPTQENMVQRSSLSTHLSDVTNTVTRAEQGERKQAKASNTADTQRKENIKSQTPREVPRPDETSLEYSEGIPDSVCLIDSRGQSLEPGDPVWFGSRLFNRKWGIYVGHKQVVWTNWRKGRLVVVKRELKLDVPFGKCRVVSGECRLFPRGEVIRRAESRVGTRFPEGDSVGSDFPYWAMSGLGWSQVMYEFGQMFYSSDRTRKASINIRKVMFAVERMRNIEPKEDMMLWRPTSRRRCGQREMKDPELWCFLEQDNYRTPPLQMTLLKPK